MKYNFAIVAFIASCICFGQIPNNVKKEIDNRVLAGDNPSIVLGYYKDGKADFYVAGVQNLETKQPATLESIYEIGSISKTFTAMLFAKMALENKVSLDTEIRTLYPDSLKLVALDGTAINFRHLATHTSGLHSYPLGYSPADPGNPYIDLDKKKLYGYLSHWGSEAAGKKYGYSNIGVGLMGEGLAIIEQKPYTQLIQAEILKPLNLSNTYFKVPQEKLKDFADGYQKGEITSHWDFDILAPAGALRADIEDLLAYGVSYLETNPLSEAQTLTTKQQFKDESGNHTIGINWFIDENTIWHGGGTYGFSTHIFINLKKREVIAIMTNTGDQNIEDIAIYLRDPENSVLYSKSLNAIKISEEILKSYVGTYSNNQMGMTFTITQNNGTLFAKLNNQKSYEYEALNEFSFINEKFKVNLIFGNEGENQTLKLNQNGLDILFKKL